MGVCMQVGLNMTMAFVLLSVNVASGKVIQLEVFVSKHLMGGAKEIHHCPLN